MAVFLGLFVAGPAGIVFYNLLPACGPIYLLGSKFPFDPLSNQQVKEMFLQPVLVSGVRNAFPSLHVAWAFLLSWYAAGLSIWTKFFVLLFLAGTVLATLGLGARALLHRFGSCTAVCADDTSRLRAGNSVARSAKVGAFSRRIVFDSWLDCAASLWPQDHVDFCAYSLDIDRLHDDFIFDAASMARPISIFKNE